MARRPRTERRARERQLRKSVRETERLALRAPGGAPDRPLSVPSASVIEGRARGTPCVLCGGVLELRAHAVDPEHGPSLRVARMVCRLCHAPREIWFRIEPSLPS